MTTEISTWRIGEFSFRLQSSAIAGSFLLWGLLSLLGWRLLHLPPGDALLLGLLATAAHWILAVIHQLGHAWAASRTGYPMIGIRFWWVLSTSLYPSNEPELPAHIHVRRALGGPTWSLVVLIPAAVWTWLIWPPQGVMGWLVVFVLADSLLTFTTGALLPLGFTDGSTLLRLWKNRKAS